MNLTYFLFYWKYEFVLVYNAKKKDKPPCIFIRSRLFNPTPDEFANI